MIAAENAEVLKFPKKRKRQSKIKRVIRKVIKKSNLSEIMVIAVGVVIGDLMLDGLKVLVHLLGWI